MSLAQTQERNQRQARRNLRNPPATRTQSQITKDNHALAISKRWTFVRRNNKASRGIENRDSECFILAALQPLLHLPRFVHWINRHNSGPEDGEKKYPCDPEARKVVETQVDENGDEVERSICVACLMKRLVYEYWNEHDLDGDQRLEPLSRRDEVMADFRSLAMHWSGNDEVLEQQDTEEFQLKLLNACLDSTAVEASMQYLQYWQPTYDALFNLQFRYTRRCKRCKALRPVREDPQDLGLNSVGLTQDESDPDNVYDAIARQSLYTEEFDDKPTCNRCGEKSDILVQRDIEGAPEYLRIGLSIFTTTNGMSVKTSVGVTIPQELDLTQLQVDRSTELKYKLTSVTSHIGEHIQSGHWISTVTGPRSVYVINDDMVNTVTDQYLTANPKQWYPGIGTVVGVNHGNGGGGGGVSNGRVKKRRKERRKNPFARKRKTKAKASKTTQEAIGRPGEQPKLAGIAETAETAETAEKVVTETQVDRSEDFMAVYLVYERIRTSSLNL